jgi:hypothetical protein
MSGNVGEVLEFGVIWRLRLLEAHPARWMEWALRPRTRATTCPPWIPVER